MKKFAFFCCFLLIFGSFTIFNLNKNNVHAETTNPLEGFDIVFNVENLTPDSDPIVLANNTASFNYSDVDSGSAIKISASLTQPAELQDSVAANFTWTQSEKTISQNNHITLYKTITNKNQIPIVVGSTTYNVTATFTIASEPLTLNKTIKITASAPANNTGATVQVFYETENNQPTITKSSSTFKLYAIYPLNTTQTISWMYKSPNSAKYVFIGEPQENKGSLSTTAINPATLISEELGLGTYSFVACVKVGGTYYYSEPINITASQDISIVGSSVFKENEICIIKSKATNSVAHIQATKFSIKNADKINADNIVWYVSVNEEQPIRVARGSSFIYEPTSTNSYRVAAKYIEENTITTIDTLVVSPKATNTWVVFVVIGASIAVLSGILVFTIVKLNKKRDVVW